LKFGFILGQIKGSKKESDESERAKKMFDRDCQLMALTWLLGRNKTAYIPTVSAVLRAVMYSAHPHESKCSPDQDNMPLAVDSLQFETNQGSSTPLRIFWIMLLMVLVFLWLKGPVLDCEMRGSYYTFLCPVLFLVSIWVSREAIRQNYATNVLSFLTVNFRPYHPIIFLYIFLLY